MLQAEQIHYRFHDRVPLLEGINCTIEPGKIVGLTGPSGCGKSTLGRLLAGYSMPQAGTINCNGGPLPATGCCPVQMIFQHPELSVNPRWRIQKILQEGNPDHEELIHLFGIHRNLLHRFPHELSGGELQRVVLIRAMTSTTKYLIADEMTASLDPGTQALIWQTIMNWAKDRQVGILAISHDTNLLKRICDKIDSLFS